MPRTFRTSRERRKAASRAPGHGLFRPRRGRGGATKEGEGGCHEGRGDRFFGVSFSDLHLEVSAVAVVSLGLGCFQILIRVSETLFSFFVLFRIF